MSFRNFNYFFNWCGSCRAPIARFIRRVRYTGDYRGRIFASVCAIATYSNLYHFSLGNFRLHPIPVISECHDSSNIDESGGENTCKASKCLPEVSKSLSIAPEAEARIRREISEYDVVLFMKGNASKPACKFSRQALDILKTSKVPIIRTVDVLESQELRSGIKIFSNYPYIPQLYVRKTFIGGLEKMLDMYNDGSLHKLLQG